MPAENITSEVPPEEVARRIAEMRRVFFEHRVFPQVVYHPPAQPCPWPDCDHRIAGIRFNLEQLVEPAHYDDALFAWWQGPGLVARCPRCRRYVVFGVLGKEMASEPLPGNSFVLPDNWDEIAYLVPQRDGRGGN